MFKQIIGYFQDRRDRIADTGRTIKVAKILRVFAREKELVEDVFSSSSVEVCKHPGRCAIGALLVAAGVGDGELVDRWSITGDFAELLWSEYGLDRSNQEGLMGANDGVHEKYDDYECTVVGVHTSYSKECGVLPVNVARVCEVRAFVRTLDPISGPTSSLSGA